MLSPFRVASLEPQIGQAPGMVHPETPRRPTVIVQIKQKTIISLIILNHQ
jgi:hypothetical protein